MTNPDIRAALAQHYEGRARAAAAAPPAPELGEVGPSESDVAELFYRHMGEGSEVGFEGAIAEALARWGHATTPPAPEVGEADLEANFRAWYQDAYGSAYFGAMPLCVAIKWAQHLLQQATPPVAEEVRELATELTQVANALADEGLAGSAEPCRRAATLLQQQQHLMGLCAKELDSLMEQQATTVVHPKEKNREFVLKEMKAEDGSSLGWYVNHPDFYCDIEKEDGVWGVYFRDKITDQDSYGEPGPPSNLITPIAVSERLPGEVDCNGHQECWAWDKVEESWTLERYENCKFFTHWWLPFHAISLPQAGEGSHQ